MELPPGPTGKRRQLTGSGNATAKQAVAARDELVRAHRAGVLPSDDARRQDSVADFLTRWLAAKVASRSIRPSTALAYRRHLDLYLIPHLGALRVRSLRRDHVEAMSAGHRLLPVIRFVAGTGLRLGEVCALPWSDVDLPAGTLVVPQQAVQVGGTLLYGKPKTRSGEDRVVPLAGWVPGVLELERKRQAAQRLPLGPDHVATGFAFTQPGGSPLLPASVSRAFTRLVKASDLPRGRCHDLRHIAATTLLAAGVRVPVVSKILGDSSIQITVDTYGHVTVDPALFDQIDQALRAFQP